jgi:hypothetical protein
VNVNRPAHPKEHHVNTVYCDYHLLLAQPPPRIEARCNADKPDCYFVSFETDRARWCASGTHAQLTGLFAGLQAALDATAGRPAPDGALASLLAAVRDLASIEALGEDPYRAVLSDGQRAQECAHRLAFLARALTSLLAADPADPGALNDVAARLRARAGTPPEASSAA